MSRSNGHAAIVPSALFPPVSYFALAVHCNQFEIEWFDYFVKQSVRNRYWITTSQGKKLLSIPLVSKSSKLICSEVKIDYSSNWQQEHIRTLNAAYSSTPFFHHYMDLLQPVFQKSFHSLVELNLWAFARILDFLDFKDMNYSCTQQYQTNFSGFDLRSKKTKHYTPIESLPHYYQLNMDKGAAFEPDLSILDLIFNMGPESRLYLLNTPVKANDYF